MIFVVFDVFCLKIRKGDTNKKKNSNNDGDDDDDNNDNYNKIIFSKNKESFFIEGYRKPITQACHYDCIEIFKMFSQNIDNSNINCAIVIRLSDYLYYASLHQGSVNIVKYLISTIFDNSSVSSGDMNHFANCSWRHILTTLCDSASKHKDYKVYHKSELIAQMLLNVIKNITMDMDTQESDIFFDKVFQRTKLGMTPLLYSCESKFSQITKLLIDSGWCDINFTNEGCGNNTPLMTACSYSSRSVENVKLLLSSKYVHRLDVNAINSNQETALHIACWGFGDIDDDEYEIVKALINCHSVDINAVDQSNRTALHIACTNKKVKIIKLLLSHKDININLIDIFMQTPLHCIVNENFIRQEKNKDACRDAVEMLLTVDNYNLNDHDKDEIKIIKNIDYLINALDENLQTALDMACKYNLESIVKIIYIKSQLYNINIDHSVNQSLLQAVEWGNIDIVKLLLENTTCNLLHVADDNKKNKNYKTNNKNALTVAIDSVYMDDKDTNEMVAFIIDYLQNDNNNNKIDNNQIDQFINIIDPISGENVYIKACQMNKCQTIKTLVNKYKVDITVQDSSGYYGSEYIDNHDQLKQWLKNQQESKYLE